MRLDADRWDTEFVYEPYSPTYHPDPDPNYRGPKPKIPFGFTTERTVRGRKAPKTKAKSKGKNRG